jgi:hypothetical protein
VQVATEFVREVSKERGLAAGQDSKKSRPTEESDGFEFLKNDRVRAGA